jgi:putative ABC transport system substrate-binding protein
MRRIGLAVVLGLTMSAFTAEAQQAGKIYRIGVLSSQSSIPDATVAQGRRAFSERLRDLGWVVGENLTYESRNADQRLDRLPGLAAELVQLNVSMILAFGNQAALAAKRATATIPIVMIAGDPVGSGLIAGLARPGGNITGLTAEAGLEILSKRLELLKEASPKITRVGILTNRSNTPEARVLDVTAPTAQALRLTFLPIDVRSPSDFDGAYAVLIRARVDALTATDNPLNAEHRGSIVAFAAGNRLPTVFGDRAFCRCGRVDVLWGKLRRFVRTAPHLCG